MQKGRYESDLCAQVYHGFDEFRILNESATPYAISTYEPGQARLLWANSALLDMVGMNLDQFTKINPAEGSTDLYAGFLDDLYQKVQVERHEDTRLKKVSHDSDSFVFNWHTRPLRIILDGETEEQVVCLVAHTAIEAPQFEDNHDYADNAMMDSVQSMLQGCSTIVMSFDQSTGEAVYLNSLAQDFYGIRDGSGDEDGLSDQLFLSDVLESCIDDGFGPNSELWNEISNLQPGSLPVEFECQKTMMSRDSDSSSSARDVWHRVRVSPAPASSGSMVLVHEVDISDRKQLQSDLLAATAKADQLVSAVTHDVREPLQSLVGLVEALMDSEDVTDEMEQPLQVVKSSSMRLTLAVEDILLAAGPSEDECALELQALKLHEVSTRVTEALPPLGRGVMLVDEVDDRLPEVHADGRRLMQVLYNLLSNAAKATEEGCVVISARVADGADDRLLVEVTDTGPGIEPTRARQIEALLQQAGGGGGGEGEVLGFGLTLVRDLVAAHGGEVGMRTKHGGEGSGTVFHLTIPLSERRGEARAEQGGPRRRVVWTEGERVRSDVDGGRRARQSDGGGDGGAEVGALRRQIESLQGQVKQLQRQVAAASVNGGESTDEAAESGGGEGGEGRPPKMQHHSDIHGTAEVLSVDDDLANHIDVENTLEPLGFVVTKCVSGEEALDRVQEREFLPDVLLLASDLQSSMSGYDLCERLRLLYPRNAIPVVVLSARGREGDAVQKLTSALHSDLSRRRPSGEAQRLGHFDLLKLRSPWQLRMVRALQERARGVTLPSFVQERLSSGEEMIVDFHESVTVLAFDLGDMLGRAERCSAEQFVKLTTQVLDVIDAVATEGGATRVIDDTYLLVLPGGPDDGGSTSTACERMVRIAMSALNQTAAIDSTGDGSGGPPRMQLGIGTGPAYSAMAGVHMSSFTYFGQAVRDAWQAAVRGAARCITLTDKVRERVPGVQTEPLDSAHNSAATQSESAERALPLFVVKEGEWRAALRAGSAGQSKVCERKGIAMSHLRAFFRLGSDASSTAPGPDRLASTASIVAPLQTEGKVGLPTGECSKCKEWEEKHATLDESMKRLQRRLQRSNSQSTLNDFGLNTLMNGGRQSPAVAAAPKSTQVEILSVDDDPVNQLVIEEMLTPVGYTVTKCMDGTEALDLLKRRSYVPDLILLDVMMPKMSGYEVCQRVRELHPRNQLPIVMVSAKSSADNIVEGLEAGCNDYVSKPFNRLELLARIATQLRVKDAWKTDVENARSTKLLQRMLPEHVIAKLKQNSGLIVEEHKEVSILFADIVGYTNLSASVPPMELINMLNEMFSAFDERCDFHGCYKVQTIGDAYMAVAGHDNRVEDHAKRLLCFALDMIEAVKSIQCPRSPGEHMKVRVGMHSGPAYAGIVGMKMPRYCFFGDAVNTASRMESNGFPMCVHVSADTMGLLQGEFDFEALGLRQIKGKGMMETYLVVDDRTPWRPALEGFRRDAVVQSNGSSVTNAEDGSHEGPDRAASDEVASNAEPFPDPAAHRHRRQSSNSAARRDSSPLAGARTDGKGRRRTMGRSGLFGRHEQPVQDPQSADPAYSEERGWDQEGGCPKCAERLLQVVELERRERAVMNTLLQLRVEHNALVATHSQLLEQQQQQRQQHQQLPPPHLRVHIEGSPHPPSHHEPPVTRASPLAAAAGAAYEQAAFTAEHASPVRASAHGSPMAAGGPTLEDVLLRHLYERDEVSTSLLHSLRALSARGGGASPAWSAGGPVGSMPSAASYMPARSASGASGQDAFQYAQGVSLSSSSRNLWPQADMSHGLHFASATNHRRPISEEGESRTDRSADSGHEGGEGRYQ